MPQVDRRISNVQWYEEHGVGRRPQVKGKRRLGQKERVHGLVSFGSR